MQDVESTPEHESRVTAVNSSNWQRTAITIAILLIIVGGSAYYLGMQKDRGAAKTSQSAYQQQANPTINRVQNIESYVKYQYKHIHLGYPVFEVEVPYNWSAYTTYGKLIYKDPATIFLGEAQNKNNNVLNDIVPSVKIRVSKDKQLAEIDPKQWSFENQLALFDSSPVSNNWTNITVNGLSAKTISVDTLDSPKDIVYIVKDDVIFTISNDHSDQATFDHILSTFKIIDTQRL